MTRTGHTSALSGRGRGLMRTSPGASPTRGVRQHVGRRGNVFGGFGGGVAMSEVSLFSFIWG